MREGSTWDGDTQNPRHAFHVKFYEDVEAGSFVAQLIMQDQTWSLDVGGTPQQLPSYAEGLVNTDLKHLQERTIQHIVRRGGKILTWREQP
jgi:hypothetical protein